MNKILKITSTICAGNISLLTTVFAMDPNRNNGTFMPVNPNKYSISTGHENPFIHVDNSSVISNGSTNVSVPEEDPNTQQQITQPVSQHSANQQQIQNIQPVIPFHNGNIPANMVNFMFPLGMGHPVPAHVAPQPYHWVLPGAVTVDFTNPRHNEYLFEIRQNGTMIFRIMGQTLDSGHISFMTWVTQQGHLRRSGSWVRLPAEANAVIRFYRCTNCGAITWHDHNNKCPNCIHNTAPGANDRVFNFNRGLASQLCKNRALCAVGNCPIN